MLVVDDNATNRHILEEILESWDMKPDDGRWTLRRRSRRFGAGHATDRRFDAVICDCKMPGIDGFTLAR